MPTDWLKRIEADKPHHIGRNLRWCGHLGANQYGCIRCAITRQNDALDAEHGKVVLLARALDDAVGAIPEHNVKPSDCNCARCGGERTLREVAGGDSDSYCTDYFDLAGGSDAD